MKYVRTGAMLFAGLAITASTAAVAGVDIGINLGAPVVVAPAPVYVAPPVYAPPPPPPPPAYYAPPPVVVAPGPAIIIGWHGDRYWDGRRYWNRDEWYRHHPPGRGHWDHGHGYDHDHGHGH